MTSRVQREVEYEGEGLRLRARSGEGTASVELEGELDMASAPAFRQALSEAASDADIVDIHAAGVRFMDSSGLRALLTALREAQSAGCRLRLVDVSPAVSRVLEVTRTASLFDLPAHG